MASDKTEHASAQRLKKAVEKGDVLFSKEVSSALALLVGTWVVRRLALRWSLDWRVWLRTSLEISNQMLREEGHTPPVGKLRQLIGNALLPVMAGGALISLCVTIGVVAQRVGSLRFTGIRLDFSRLNPSSNLSRMIGIDPLLKAAKSVMPVIAIMVALVAECRHLTVASPFTLFQLVRAAQSTYHLLISTALILLAYSVADLWGLWRARRKRLKMTKQERRDEDKEIEGNPQTKRRVMIVRRQFRRQARRGDVSKAKVVITNPTEYAVGLSFDFESLDAPRVVAKGRNLAAAEIREDARRAGVPLVENPALARCLYKDVAVGSSIPGELYAAVASIISYLFRGEVERRLKHRRRAAGPEAKAIGRSTAKPSVLISGTQTV